MRSLDICLKSRDYWWFPSSFMIRGEVTYKYQLAFGAVAFSPKDLIRGCMNSWACTVSRFRRGEIARQEKRSKNMCKTGRTKKFRWWIPSMSDSSLRSITDTSIILLWIFEGYQLYQACLGQRYESPSQIILLPSESLYQTWVSFNLFRDNHCDIVLNVKSF